MRACVRALSGLGLVTVGGQVALHVPLLGELLVAAGTLERLLPVVAEHVPLHAAQGEEALGAQRAPVRPLPRVGAHVHY